MTAARHLSVAPDPAGVLQREIAEVCVQIDGRLGNPRGTAERGVYFWHWPPHPAQTVETLAALHADAVAFLHKLTTREDLP